MQEVGYAERNVVSQLQRLSRGVARRIKARVGPRPGIAKRALLTHLPADAVIVEAGAHIGVDTEELARKVPRGIVHAFEPVPDLYRRMEARTSAYSNVQAYQLALADKSGTMPLWVGRGHSDGASSLRSPKSLLEELPDITFDETIEVEVTSLDDWAAKHAIERVDGMWLDMQGYELATLRASPRVLASVRAIVTEVFLTEQYDGAPLWPEVRHWLERQGFEIAKENLFWDNGGDILAVRR